MLEAATRAREHAQRAGVTSLEASASTSMGTALMYGASPWADYEAFGSALLADRDRLGHVAANVRGGLAMAAAYQLRFEESAQIFEQFAADLLERGNEVGLRSISQNRAYARQLAGDLDAAESIYREAWDAYGELGERGFRSTVGGLLALTLLELGRRAEAEAIAAESAELAPSDDWLTAASLAAVEARIATDDGRHDDAVATARRAVEIGNEGYILLAPWWATELGRALAAAGRAEEARGTLEEAMRLARAKGSAVYELRAQALLDDLGR
jgi:tetratricopeptide (TPR) repeat protein